MFDIFFRIRRYISQKKTYHNERICILHSGFSKFWLKVSSDWSKVEKKFQTYNLPISQQLIIYEIFYNCFVILFFNNKYNIYLKFSEKTVASFGNLASRPESLDLEHRFHQTWYCSDSWSYNAIQMLTDRFFSPSGASANWGSISFHWSS